MASVRLFVDALKSRSPFPAQLGIHKIPHSKLGDDVWAMRWGYDCRALFTYGAAVKPGQKHIVWLAIGSHDNVY
jgi:hypothetical protein